MNAFVFLNSRISPTCQVDDILLLSYKILYMLDDEFKIENSTKEFQSGCLGYVSGLAAVAR